MGCNAVSSSPEVPLLFWWQGPDGSKLMTIYWGKNYGTSLVPDKDWKYKTWLAIIHTGDNQEPPSPEDVEKVLTKAQKLAPNAKLKIGRISDFYDAIMKEDPVLPVVRGDMPDTWIHGYMSMPREMKSVRTLQKDIYSLEKLNTLSNLWSDQKEDVTQFYVTQHRIGHRYYLFATTYQINVILKSDEVITLVKGLYTPEQGRFLENKIEDFLDITDIHVDGELAKD